MGRVIVIVILLNVTLCFSFAGSRSLRAEQGTIDFSTIGFADVNYRVLNGEYEFYWKSLLFPDSINKSSNSTPQIYAVVPSYWSEFGDDSYPEKGFATYNLKIILPDSFRQELTFDIPVFDSSYELFLNGESVSKNGKVGTSLQSEVPGYAPRQINFQPLSDTIQLTVWVSNFNHRRGGFWKEMRFGPRLQFEPVLRREVFYSLLTVGVLLAFSLLFLFFFIGDRKNQSMIFFSLILLGVAVRVCVSGSYYITDLYPVSWKNMIRMEYLSLALILLAGFYFFADFIKSKILKRFAHVNAAICVAFSVLILTLSVSVFSHFVVYFEVIFPLVFIVVIVLSVKDAIEGSLGAVLNITGIIIVLFAFINDVLIATSKATLFDNYIAQYAVMVFAFMHGLIIIYKWVETYQEKAELNNVVTYINSNLEKLVAERTDELKDQNQRIEKQNREMSDALELNNRLFSIIGHDLRSPLATLFQLAEVLGEEDVDEVERKKIIRSLRQLSRSTGDMIDNLVYWGRSQGQALSYNPSFGYIRDVYNSLAEMLVPIAEQKGIELQFEDYTRDEVYFDKELMNLVIRNLIGNAIKFTPPQGNVTLSVNYNKKEKCHVVSVQDTGVGMSQNLIDAILTGENNKSTPGTKGEKGTGLGLILCKDLIEMHGGAFSIESREGVGSRFYFTLPDKSKAKATLIKQKT